MKISVSLSDEDLAVLDDYVERTGLPSRSAGVQRALQVLRHPTLEDDYADAWAAWSADYSTGAWEHAVGDGVTDAAR
jgi:Arc/MetJ-type ribon-helix-helix transcriptional regulator